MRRTAGSCRRQSSPGKMVWDNHHVAQPSTPGECFMVPLTLPEPIAHTVATLASLLDARQADLLGPLFQGILFAHGRRTATSWFRAGDLAADFHRGYDLL